MNKRTINRAIRHLGLEVRNERRGYSYFTSLATGDQIGDSVPVCYLNQQTVEQWADDARRALNSGVLGGMFYGKESPEFRKATTVRKVLKLSGRMRVLDVTPEEPASDE